MKKCPFCTFKTKSHSEWKDHMAECYEKRHFCKKCDYSTDKRVNYLRHLKRNHTEQADGELRNVRHASSDNCEASSSKQLQGE
jgi:hypothetical protein